MDAISPSNSRDRFVRVPAGALFLKGSLRIPEKARGIVLFPYGIENDQRISYTEGLAPPLGEAGFATLLVDLLTPEEKGLDALTGFFRENVDILHKRIIGIANWLREEQETQKLRISYFCTGVTGAAALIAAAVRPDAVETGFPAHQRIHFTRNYLSN